MSTNELIEQIHRENAMLRRAEHNPLPLKRKKVIWSIAAPAAAAAAILLIVLLPRNNEVQAAVPTGIYCNSQCNPDDVLTLIDNNIDHIRTIQAL